MQKTTKLRSRILSQRKPAINRPSLRHISTDNSLPKVRKLVDPFEIEIRMEIAIEQVASKLAKKTRNYFALMSEDKISDANLCKLEIDALLCLRDRLYRGDKSVLPEVGL